MATLVLTAVGTLVGGPIGGAIGAIVGQQVDQRLFGPKGARGPRLGDLSVQVSSYGQPIPKLFGRLRVAGTVIWATDLIEDKHKHGGGKGKPKTTSYSYSASLAVALSARAIIGVERIWADGKLLRGAGGDWKSEVGAFRLHLGDEGQPADPLIAAAEDGATPAYRGAAYAVFEDLQLADFGNRIPSLTFEVTADAGAVSLGMIARALDPALGGGTVATVDGFAADGDSVRGAIETLAAIAPLSLGDDGARLVVSDRPADGGTLPADAGASADDSRADARALNTDAAGTLPDEVAVRYYEPERDFQAGLQRARRGGPGRRVEAIDLPAVLPAAGAKAAAERRLATIWAERRHLTVLLPHRHAGLRPGRIVAVPGLPGRWRVASVAIEHMVVEAKLVGVAAAGVTQAAAAGRPVENNDTAHGTTVLALLDLPPLDDVAGTAPRLWIAAAGPEPGWRRAALMLSLDGGASFATIGDTAAPAVMGQATSVLTDGGSALVDRRSSVTVVLLNDEMALQSAGAKAIGSGANLAMLGRELIQFETATPLGGGAWRLGGLWRGRRGTEWAAGLHTIGERFVLIERDTLLPVDLAAADLGGAALVVASGIGDPIDGVSATMTVGDAVIAPPSPVRLAATRRGDGGVDLAWTRRSRAGWAWIDAADAPLGEERERYRVTLTPSVGSGRVVEVDAPTAAWTGADRTADGADGADAVTISVVQLGLAPSRPATVTIML